MFLQIHLMQMLYIVQIQSVIIFLSCYQKWEYLNQEVQRSSSKNRRLGTTFLGLEHLWLEGVSTYAPKGKWKDFYLIQIDGLSSWNYRKIIPPFYSQILVHKNNSRHVINFKHTTPVGQVSCRELLVFIFSGSDTKKACDSD